MGGGAEGAAGGELALRVPCCLPGQELVDSGCHCKGFRTEEEATEYWVREGWELPAPRHYQWLLAERPRAAPTGARVT